MKTDLLDLSTWTTYFSEATAQLKATLVGYLPNIVGAILVFLAGLLLAKLFKYIGSKIGHFIFKVLSALEKKYNLHGRRARPNYSKIIGHLLYWVVLIYFIFFALKILNIPGITAWIIRFTSFIPNLIGALIIVYIGFVLGAVARNFIYTGFDQRIDQDPYFLAQTLRFGIITLFIIWGVGQVGVNINVLTNFINIIVAAIFGAAALGFGLGSRGHVANMIAAYNFKKSFQIGDAITMDDIKGIIVDITSCAIVIDTAQGIILMPAKRTLDCHCIKG